MNREIFCSLKEAQIIIESWRQHYNRSRPHSELAIAHRSNTVRQSADATGRAEGMSLVRNITLLAVIGVLLLQWTNSIPLASVGGSLTIAMAFFAAALVVGIHEAWTRSRGVIGWIVNIVVSLVGAFVAAQIGGMTIVMMLSRVANLDGSLAKTGGAAMSVALTGGMVATIFGSWIALQIVNRWR